MNVICVLLSCLLLCSCSTLESLFSSLSPFESASSTDGNDSTIELFHQFMNSDGRNEKFTLLREMLAEMLKTQCLDYKDLLPEFFDESSSNDDTDTEEIIEEECESQRNLVKVAVKLSYIGKLNFTLSDGISNLYSILRIMKVDEVVLELDQPRQINSVYCPINEKLTIKFIKSRDTLNKLKNNHIFISCVSGMIIEGEEDGPLMKFLAPFEKLQIVCFTSQQSEMRCLHVHRLGDSIRLIN